MTQRGVERLVADRLSDRGIRFTRGRRSVVRVLRSASGPKSAAELGARLGGDVPVSSLYRTLGVLERAGVVTPHHGARDVTRYELGEWLRGHHHHLVCSQCGRVEDVALDEAGERLVEQASAGLAEDSGFRLAGHTLEIEGVCASCLP